MREQQNWSNTLCNILSWTWNKTQEATIYVKEKVEDPEFQQNVKEGASYAWDKTVEGTNYIKETLSDEDFISGLVLV